jgi:hypothetical protein
MKRRGLFNLQTPNDLLAKARHDLKRLQTDPADAYAAFDFFVTVRHLPEWLHPNDKQKQNALFEKHVELRIARQLGDGAKHFEATHSQHFQVAGTSALPAAFQDDAFEPEAFQIGALIIELDARDAETVAVGRQVNVVELAQRVLRVAESIVA